MSEKTDSLDSILQKLWQQEAVREDPPHLTEAERLAEEHFRDTHHRADDARYIVKLPRLLQTPQLGQSKPMAVRRFHQNRRSLQRKGQWEPFCAVMDEYSHLQHSELVPPKDLHKPSGQTYHLPSHGVSKYDNTTTKLRAVFDTSASTTSGASLNDTLLPGPSLFPALTTILIRFRTHPIAICGDVSKMF